MTGDYKTYFIDIKMNSSTATRRIHNLFSEFFFYTDISIGTLNNKDNIKYRNLINEKSLLMINNK